MKLLKSILLVMLLCIFSCKENAIEVDPYNGKSWVEFTITHPDADTINYRFESINDSSLVGGTYFKANGFTVCYVKQKDKINKRQKNIFLTFSGSTTGTFYTSNDSTPMFLDLSTDEYPSVFVPDMGKQTGIVDVQEYGVIGERISGKFSYIVRWGISPVLWKMLGTFSVVRKPDNLINTLFSYKY